MYKINIDNSKRMLIQLLHLTFHPRIQKYFKY